MDDGGEVITAASIEMDLPPPPPDLPDPSSSTSKSSSSKKSSKKDKRGKKDKRKSAAVASAAALGEKDANKLDDGDHHHHHHQPPQQKQKDQQRGSADDLKRKLKKLAKRLSAAEQRAESAEKQLSILQESVESPTSKSTGPGGEKENDSTETLAALESAQAAAASADQADKRAMAAEEAQAALKEALRCAREEIDQLKGGDGASPPPPVVEADEPEERIVEDLQRQLSASQDKLSEAKEALNQLNQQLAAARDAQRQSDTIVQQVKEQLRKTDEEVVRLRAELEQSELSSSALSPRPPPPPPEEEEEEEEEDDDNVDDAAKQAESLTEAPELSKLRQLNDELTNERDLHRDRADTAEDAVEVLQKEIDELRSENSQLADSVASQQSQLDKQRHQMPTQSTSTVNQASVAATAARNRDEYSTAGFTQQLEANAPVTPPATAPRSSTPTNGPALSAVPRPRGPPPKLTRSAGGTPMFGRGPPPAVPIVTTKRLHAAPAGLAQPLGSPAAVGRRARSSTEPPLSTVPPGQRPPGPPPAGPPSRQSPHQGASHVRGGVPILSGGNNVRPSSTSLLSSSVGSSASEQETTSEPALPAATIQRYPAGRTLQSPNVRSGIPAQETFSGPKGKLHGPFAGMADKNEAYKSYMEDSHVEIPNLMPNFAYFGVYDGHSGRECVDYVTQNLHIVLSACLASGMEPQAALAHSYAQMDQELAELSITKSGCTAVSLLIRSTGKQREVFVANAGDARAVLCGPGLKAQRLSYDHKVEDAAEQARVEAAGAVILWNKVNGSLAVTRALGDHDLKKFVISEPYQSRMSLSKGHLYILLACDGIFDVMSDQQCVDVMGKMGAKNPAKAVSKLIEKVKELKSKDNLCALAVAL